MKSYRLVAILLCASFFGTGRIVIADDDGPPPVLSIDGRSIVSLDQKSDVGNLPTITFYVRYPEGLNPKDKVEGVFADVTWFTDKQKLLSWVKRSSSDDTNFQFADEHKLAIVTWTTSADVYSNDDSFDQDTSAERDPTNLMEQSFRTWKVGIDRICRDNSLPNDGFLIYGVSRGAQWAHRIVLRCPEKFLAVHIHINSSYEEPTSDASHCLWLLTTGELEHGSVAARVFFQKAQALNYPVLLRIYPGRAHDIFPDEEILGLKFFDYALKLKDQQLKSMASDMAETPSAVSEDQPFVLDDSFLGDFRKPKFYGDMLNGDVYPAPEISLLPETQRVGIPNLDLAKSWGYFHP